MTVLNIKAGNRLLLRADKMAQIAITAKQINIKRQRIEEVVDCTDAAAHAFLFWKKATKPVLMSPVPKVNLDWAIELLQKAGFTAVYASQVDDMDKKEELCRDIIRLAFLADEYLRNWKAEGL